jgi:ADP-ribosylglycohydrolase
MAIPIAREVAAGADLLAPQVMSRVGQAWMGWAHDAPDVGSHTRRVLQAAANVARYPGMTHDALHAASHDIHVRTGHTGGNGCLMRTAPVALAYPDDRERTALAAAQYAALTHWDPDAVNACVLWVELIRLAVKWGGLLPDDALLALEARDRPFFAALLDDARDADPATWTHTNGEAVDALRTAWACVTGYRDAPSAAAALRAAVRAGGDTDTTAAITGGLVGALHGYSALPPEWDRIVHGWPGTTLASLPTVILGW